MLFFGAFALLVLPLFLVISARAIDNSDSLKHSVAGKILKVIFYLFAAMAILAFLIIFFRILSDA